MEDPLPQSPVSRSRSHQGSLPLPLPLPLVPVLVGQKGVAGAGDGAPVALSRQSQSLHLLGHCHYVEPQEFKSSRS